MSTTALWPVPKYCLVTEPHRCKQQHCIRLLCSDGVKPETHKSQVWHPTHCTVKYWQNYCTERVNKMMTRVMKTHQFIILGLVPASCHSPAHSSHNGMHQTMQVPKNHCQIFTKPFNQIYRQIWRWQWKNHHFTINLVTFKSIAETLVACYLLLISINYKFVETLHRSWSPSAAGVCRAMSTGICSTLLSTSQPFCSSLPNIACMPA